MENYQDKIESRINSSDSLLYARGMKKIEESLRGNLNKEYPDYHLKVPLSKGIKEGQTLLDIRNKLEKLGYIVLSCFDPMYVYNSDEPYQSVSLNIIVPMKDESEEHCKQRIKKIVLLHYYEDESHDDVYPKGTSKIVLDVIHETYKGE